MEIIGLDIGFGFTKIHKGRTTRVFKSVYGDATEVQFRENVLGDWAETSHIHVEFEGGSYFVGELAERQSLDRFFTLDQNEFVTRFVKTLALGGLAGMVERHQPIHLVTGLPISQFRRHRKRIASILKGTHEVTLVGPDDERIEQVVKIQEVRVVPQPFGSVLDLMLNDIGEVADSRYLKEKVGIIDVGFKTTDYMVADSAHYSERGSSTSDHGISRAFNSISNALQQSTGVVPELYRLYDSVDRGYIKIRGRQIDLEPLTQQAFTQLAKVISTEANRLWSDDWDIDHIVITGGGGKALAPFLGPQLLGEVVAVDQDVDSRFNNVRGYMKYGMRLWSRGAKAMAESA